MANTATTLSSAMTLADDYALVTSATGATVGQPVRIGNEWAAVVQVVGTRVKLRSRGDQGTAATPHNAGEPVVFSDGTAGDVADPPPTKTSAVFPGALYDDQVAYGASGAIAVPRKNTLAVITKATAAAMTLAAPNKADNGVTLTILSQTAAAHTVTYAAGFYGAGTSDVGTFAAAIGASMTVTAINGTWGVVALANVTLA
jgi:hypothetical protein